MYSTTICCLDFSVCFINCKFCEIDRFPADCDTKSAVIDMDKIDTGLKSAVRWKSLGVGVLRDGKIRW